MAAVDFEQGPGGVKLAFLQDGPADDLGRCGFFWLGGFKSDMTGTKAEAMAALARETRRPGLRFDYSGHGKSGGLFTDGTISEWLEQSIHMFITKTHSKRIIVGSSMGGWLALLLAKVLLRDDPRAARRIAGIVLVAPAADMTSDLMWDMFSASSPHPTGRSRRLHAALKLWRAPAHHPEASAGRHKTSAAENRTRIAMPGAHPPGQRRSRRAAIPCAESF